jgi:hypothetical protein
VPLPVILFRILHEIKICHISLFPAQPVFHHRCTKRCAWFLLRIWDVSGLNLGDWLSRLRFFVVFLDSCRQMLTTWDSLWPLSSRYLWFIIRIHPTIERCVTHKGEDTSFSNRRIKNHGPRKWNTLSNLFVNTCLQKLLSLFLVWYENECRYPYSEIETWIEIICKISYGEFWVWTEYLTENLHSLMFYIRFHISCHQPSVSAVLFQYILMRE